MTSPAEAQSITPRRTPKMAANQSVNVNHLLNFRLPPRQSQPLTSLPRRSRKTGNQQGFWNKERFVNAQYRFVMNPAGDYTVHFADPDIFFQWQDILQVIIPRNSALASAASGGEQSSQEGHTTCPICLAPPSAPRMTKCGHVFCFPCILHYLNTSENKWARCPICFDSVNEKQLKSVKWYDGPPPEAEDQSEASSSISTSSAADTLNAAPQAGSMLRMRLMQRPQITTLALPRSHTWPSDLLPPHQAPFHYLPDVFEYAKFMLATPAYLVSDLTTELDQLATERRVLSGMNDDLSASFVDAADAKVRHQITKAAALENPMLMEKIEKAYRDLREIQDRFAYHANRAKEDSRDARLDDTPRELLALRDNSLKPVGRHPAPNAARGGPRQRKNVNPPPPSTSTYYYYQAASGLPIFLHPLDIKILLSNFQSYSSFPDSITIRVDAMSEGTVNDDLRKRCKYLAHMPEGADVVFIEADLTGVVGSDGLKSFEQALRMRTSRRREKGKKDDRAKARAEEKDRERRDAELSRVWVGEHYTPPPLPAETIVVEHEAEEEEEQTSALPAPPASGAWGSRSFASALHTGRAGQPRAAARQPQEDVDEWDIDAAWHELESRNGGGGRRKRSNKLVVLGGGGGRRR